MSQFHQSSAITTLCWPHGQPHEVVFGLAEGKVKVGQLKSNKLATLYAHPDHSYVATLCSSPDGRAILSGKPKSKTNKKTIYSSEYGPDAVVAVR